MTKRIFAVFVRAALAVALILLPAQSAFSQSTNPDHIVSGNSFYIALASNVPWTQLNANYIFTPITPNAGVCVFVENLNPTNPHTVTLAAFQTGNPSNRQFSGNTGEWVQVSVLNPFASVPAHTVNASFFSATGAANVTITVSGAVAAGGGSPDTANIFATQSNNGTCGATGGATLVQGSQSPGTALITNPVISAGVLNSPTDVEPFPLTGTTSDWGLEEGFSAGIGSTISNYRLFGLNGTSSAAMGVEMFPYFAGSGGAEPLGGNPTPTGSGFSGTVPNSAFVQNAGQSFTLTQTVTNNSTGSIASTANPQGVHRGCQFILKVNGSITGTSPTLDVFIQDSIDGSVWDDRVHFAQLISTSTGSFVAAINVGSFVPRATTDATLAAGTIADGQLAPFLRAKFVVSGTSPSFPIQVLAACQ